MEINNFHATVKSIRLPSETGERPRQQRNNDYYSFEILSLKPVNITTTASLRRIYHDVAVSRSRVHIFCDGSSYCIRMNYRGLSFFYRGVEYLNSVATLAGLSPIAGTTIRYSYAAYSKNSPKSLANFFVLHSRT